MSGKNLVPQLWPKILSTNQTPGFLDSEYLWKESIDVLGFLHGACHQGKVAYETTTFGWVWPVKSLAQSDFRIL